MTKGSLPIVMVVCRCLPAVRRHMGAPSYHQNAGYCTMFSRHWQGPSPLSGRSRPRALTSPKGGAALWAAKPKNKGLPIGSHLFLGQDVSDDKNSLRYIAPYTVYTIRGTIERLPPYFVSLSAIILRLFIRGCSCRRAS